MNENPNVTKVYGRKGCVQCNYTTKMMKKEGIAHDYIDIDKNQIANEEVKNRANGTQLPLVVSGQKQWQGFSPDRIKELKDDGTQHN